MFLASLFKKSAFVFGLAAFQVSNPTPDSVVKSNDTSNTERLVNLVQSYFDNTKSLAGSFEQVSLRARTGRKSRRSGRVRLMRPNLIRWDFKRPEPVHYVANDKILWVYQPQDALAYRMNVGESDLDQAIRFLAGGIKIKSTFKARAIEKPKDLNNAKLSYLELLPKGSSASFRSLVLGVDPTTGAVGFSSIIDPDGNETQTTYTNFNAQPLKSKIFEFKPPEGVTVQDLSKRVDRGQ